MSRDQGLNLFSFALLLVCLAIFSLELAQHREQIDDAYISYRYARNLIEGHGLVFNVGERVEGFTNLSWTLLISIGLASGLTAEATAQVLGFLSASALLVASFVYARLALSTETRWLAGLAPCLLVASNSFNTWSLSGLETPLFALLILLALIASAQDRIGLATTFASLAFLTRPDGLLIAVTIIGFHLLRQIARHRSLKLEARAWAPAFAFAVVVIGITAFRWGYYGDVVPNTFHAKVGGVPVNFGVNYIKAFFLDGPIFLLLAVPFAIDRSSRLLEGVLFSLILMLYVASVGGDVFWNGRFLLPLLPVLVALGLCGVGRVMNQNALGGGVLLLGILVTIPWSLYGPSFELFAPASPENRTNIQLQAPFKRSQSRQMNAVPNALIRVWVARLNKYAPDPQLVAALGIGRMGYYGRFPILDLLGLVDKRVAKSKSVAKGLRIPGHQRANAAYIIQRAPDLILIPKKADTISTLPAINDLWSDPELERQYDWDEQLRGYRRKADVER